jgi:hypothetical protein
LAGIRGTSGYLDGTGSDARFLSPEGVAADSSGNVFVADTGNNSIRKITAAGAVTTLAGSHLNSGSRDGTGFVALFASPTGMAVDSSGNVYVADVDNDIIRKVTPAGVVTTIGGAAGIVGSTDGTGSGALFNSPYGVAVDSAGNVYVADTFNNTIRKGVSAGGSSGGGQGSGSGGGEPQTGNPGGSGSTTTPSSGGGGGGGAPSLWFYGALSLLVALRQGFRRK